MNRYGLGLRDYLHDSLESENYTVCSGILKARDFGVPQLRRRYIAIGVRNDILGQKKLSLQSHHSIQKQERELTTEMIIGDLDTYKDRGGYGSGTIHGDWRYNTVAKSLFQKEMRKLQALGKWYYMEYKNSQSSKKSDKKDGSNIIRKEERRLYWNQT